jgi:NADH:ubiquinone oxidoreductase subunit E
MIGRVKIIICLGSSCFARGNHDLVAAINRYINRNQLNDRVEFRGDHCFGNCSEGPNMYIGERLFQNVTKENLEEMLDEGLKVI